MRRSEFQRNLSSLLKTIEKSPDEVATRLVERYADMAGLAIADYYELTDVCKISPKSALLLRNVSALGARRRTEFFRFGRKHTEAEILEYLKGLYFDAPNETLYLLTVDSDDRVLSCEYVGEGTVNSFGIMPRKLLELMVRKNCKRAIVAHNHPGGYAKASVEDIDTTEKISSLFRTADRELICHYIIAGEEHCKIDTGKPLV